MVIRMCKILNRIINLLWIIVLCALLPFAVYADDSGNVTAVQSGDILATGDTVTISLSDNAMTVSSFTCGVAFDPELVKVVAVTPSAIALTDDTVWEPLVVSTPQQANENGAVGFAYANSADRSYEAGTVAEITFEAIAEGNAVFTLYEDSDGQDGNRSDSLQTLTCQISNDMGAMNYLVHMQEKTDTSVSISMVNKAETAANGFFVVAVYDREGRMLYSQEATGPFAPDAETLLTVSWQAQDDAAEVRAFVLDENHAPIRAKWQASLQVTS